MSGMFLRVWRAVRKGCWWLRRFVMGCRTHQLIPVHPPPTLHPGPLGKHRARDEPAAEAADLRDEDVADRATDLPAVRAAHPMTFQPIRTPGPDRAVDVLNRALEADPDGIRAFFKVEILINRQIAHDPTIQVGPSNHRTPRRANRPQLCDACDGADQRAVRHRREGVGVDRDGDQRRRCDRAIPNAQLRRMRRRLLPLPMRAC